MIWRGCGRRCAGEQQQTLPEAKSSPGREDCLSYNGGTESGLGSLRFCSKVPFVFEHFCHFVFSQVHIPLSALPSEISRPPPLTTSPIPPPLLRLATVMSPWISSASSWPVSLPPPSFSVHSAHSKPSDLLHVTPAQKPPGAMHRVKARTFSTADGLCRSALAASGSLSSHPPYSPHFSHMGASLHSPQRLAQHSVASGPLHLLFCPLHQLLLLCAWAAFPFSFRSLFKYCLSSF